jgi:sialate O-acetylesterase
MRTLPTVVLVLCGAAAFAGAQQPAALRLLPPFGDAMVLPQSAVVPMRGQAAPGAQVTVHVPWIDIAPSAMAGADGAFVIKLPTPAAGGPHELEVRCGDARLVVRDVLVGDVWLASGQSNMEMALGAVGGWQQGVHDWQREVAAADLPLLRVFTVERRIAAAPVDEVAGRWQVCSKATAAAFSATAFFFGRELVQRRGEPIG